jgi:hypothetical protein
MTYMNNLFSFLHTGNTLLYLVSYCHLQRVWLYAGPLLERMRTTLIRSQRMNRQKDLTE